MNISAEVSSLESMVESLTAENKTLNSGRIVSECENAQLRIANHRLQAERDAAIRTAEQLKIILDQAGAAIVHGMNKFHAVKRANQEEQISNEGNPPLFLTEQQAAE